jgi:hypothetical protein
MKLAKTSIE